jgi:hypothetical protein
MPSAPSRVLLLAAVVLTTACHARYRKHAGGLGTVTPAVRVPGLPGVDAGPSAGGVAAGAVAGAATEGAVQAVEGIAEAATGIGGAVLEGRVEGKLIRAIQPAEARAAFATGLRGTAGEAGLPYALGPDSPHRLDIEVTDYGFAIRGSQVSVRVDASVRLTKKGERRPIYRAGISCDRPLPGGLPVPLPIEGVDTLLALQRLDDIKAKKLEKLVLEAAEACGADLAHQLGRHSR